MRTRERAQISVLVICKYGWLTALDVSTYEVWQASRWGMLRDSDETSHRLQLKELLKPIAVA